MLEDRSQQANRLSPSIRSIDECDDLQISREQNLASARQSAIVEVDLTKLFDGIAEAKKVIVERARELFQTSGDNFEEEQALDDAICALHALHGTMKSRSGATADMQRS